MKKTAKKPSIDVLFITPASRAQVYQSLGNDYAAIEPPVWSMLIANYLRNRGFGVAILDAEAENLSHDATANRIVEANATLNVFVVYGQQPSASTQCMPAGRTVCVQLKEKNPQAVTIVMGTHASALPERTLREEPFQYVCQGEGPVTILKLLEMLKAGTEQHSSVPGLWYWENGAPKGNKTAGNLANLDSDLPGQAWDLVDMTKYRAHNWHCFDHIEDRMPYASIQTSLGCPFKCSFCCINTPFGGAGIRYWSPDHIIKEIDTVVQKYGVKNIKFPDEMFVLNEQHVLGICDHIIERGYDLNIWAYARVDTVKEKFLDKLKQAGFLWLALGIESGSKHVRDGVEKGRFGETDIEKTVNKIRDKGIYIVGNYIFGLPDDTYESMGQTLELAKNLNVEWANFYSAMAYPGSALYKMAQDKGWALPKDWIGYSQHAFEAFPLPTETLKGSEVLAFRDEAFLDYFTDPKYLNMVEKTFGTAVVAHVKEMTKHKVKRQFTEQKSPLRQVG